MFRIKKVLLSGSRSASTDMKTAFSGSSLSLPLVAVILSLLGRFVADLEFGYPLYIFVQQPISMIGWAVIAVVSWRRFHKGETSWKGRVYDLKNSPRG
jgi:hypothetical protein